MASEATSSTPEKSVKRPKLDSESSISDLPDLSPIKDHIDDHNSVTDIDGFSDSSYAVFPSFTTDGDHHTSCHLASNVDRSVDRDLLSDLTTGECSSDFEDAFFPSQNASLKSVSADGAFGFFTRARCIHDHHRSY